MRVDRLALALTGTLLVALSACAQVDSDQAGGGSPLTIGTTDQVTGLDPAGTWDLGSATLHGQVYRWLMTSKPGSTQPVPDIAESAEFTSPTEFTVKIRPGLTFANGHKLTASDVKFSFERMRRINDPNGPSQLLADLDDITVQGDDTVVFKLKSKDNVLWPQILTSPAAMILDEEVFPEGKLAEDAEIVKANAFNGPFVITAFKKNEVAQMKRNESYDGILGEAKSAELVAKYYAEPSNLKLDIEQGNIDIAYRTLGPTAVADLESKPGIKVYKGPGAEMRFMVFDFTAMPYGSSTGQADPAKATAVRQAAADLIDRNALAKDVYLGTYSPVYSQVPAGLDGAAEPYKSLYGDGNGGPDVERAKKRLADAGVETPVALNLQYNNDHYGDTSAEEYALIKAQLETGGLFEVNLQTTIWSQYIQDQAKHEYPAYQLGWFSDYPDSDNYLNIIYGSDDVSSLLGKENEKPELSKLIEESRVAVDPAARTGLIEKAQQMYAEYVPTLPLLQGSDIVIARDTVEGVETTLDASFRFRMGVLSKSS